LCDIAKTDIAKDTDIWYYIENPEVVNYDKSYFYIIEYNICNHHYRLGLPLKSVVDATGDKG